MEFQKSAKGHICFKENDYGATYEYVEIEGSIYRADAHNPLDVDGRRQGLRWWCYNSILNRVIWELPTA